MAPARAAAALTRAAKLAPSGARQRVEARQVSANVAV
jgi:hypothetical protein